MVALVMAAVVVGARWSSMALPVAGHPYVRLYDPPTTRAEAMLVVGDGQAFAALAQDPTLARPGVFRSTVNDAPPGAEAAYRAQRPLLGWLVWLASAGQARLVPAAMLWATIASAALLALVAAELARRSGRRVDLAPLVLVAPGALVVLGWTGVELLATALALAGVLAWQDRRRGLAVALMAAAALGRETMLLVPLALGACEWWAAGHHVRRAAVARVAPLAVPAVAWGSWVWVVHARIGWWPGDAGAARLGLPLGGLAEAIGRWGLLELVVAVATWGLAAAACLRLGRPWGWIVVAHAAFASLLGSDVLRTWVGFSRVLLPVAVLGVVALLPVEPVAADPPQSGAGEEAHPEAVRPGARQGRS
jgi:hypothetical protein